MTDRERQRQLDELVYRFLTALEEVDFDSLEHLWSVAAVDPELESAFVEAASELSADYDREFGDAAGEILENAVTASMPTVEIIRRSAGPLTVAEVAERIRRSGSPGLSAVDLVLNDSLERIREHLPDDLGLTSVIAWGSRFGEAPASYWRLFRQAAIRLRLQRAPDAEYRLAARPGRPKRPDGGQP